ncbi:VOC family protein [Georgenia phoenicis]|uniref:VOC family protein n=1 Tax=unclassified Georgenia TaxID=2626815 RepID=UPI0039AFA199
MSRHHSIDYVEIPVRDLEVSKQFYAAAFGWQFTDYGPGYSGIRGEGEREAGGLVQVDDVRPGGPLVILYSDDLEASLAAVEQAGGRVVAPPYDFPGGRRFELEDPSGHRLAVWTEQTGG